MTSKEAQENLRFWVWYLGGWMFIEPPWENE